MGSISLENMSSVIVDPNENKAYVDMDAMHARSEIERRVKYFHDREEVPDGLLYWIVWVTVETGENGPYYAGVAASELVSIVRINVHINRWANMLTHMEKSLKGKLIVEHMDDKSKQLLAEFLQGLNQVNVGKLKRIA